MAKNDPAPKPDSDWIYRSNELGAINTEDLLKNIKPGPVSIDRLGDWHPYQFTVTAEHLFNRSTGESSFHLLLNPVGEKPNAKTK